MNPLISVIIPTKNSSKFLEECLQSVKNQTYKNIEIIVVDNNSTDRTKEIAGKYTDKVFTKGPERSAQRNFGLKNSAGEYVVFVDSDMQLTPRVTEACMEEINRDRAIKGIKIPEESFGVGFWAKCKKLEKSFYNDVDWMQGARFFEKGVVTEAGGYDENMISGEDWDLSQRIENKHKNAKIKELILHNEGEIDLFQTVKKKYYYAKHFAKYAKKEHNKGSTQNQTSIISRYKLFLTQPKKLFKDPLVGLEMLFMKTCEFGFGGMGYLFSN